MNIMFKKYRGLSAAIKVSLWFTICKVLQKGISFLTVPIFTRLLTPTEYGQFSLYQTWLNLISLIATLSLSAGVFNNGLIKYENDADRFTSSIQGLSTVTTLVTFVLYCVGYEFWNSLLGLPTIVVCAIFLEILMTPALDYWTCRQRFHYKYTALTLLTICTSIAAPVVGLIAVTHTDEKGIARILAQCILNACVGGVFYFLNALRGKKFYDRKYWTYALNFNIPLIPHYLSLVILAQSDRVMIEKMFGTEKVAYYSLAYSLGMVMSIVSSAVNTSLIPWTYQSCKKGAFSRLGNVVGVVVVGIGMVTLIPIIFAPEMVEILGSTEYADAVWCVPPISIAMFFTFVYSTFTNVEFYYEENKFIMIASCIAAVANIILNLLFMPAFGYYAAAYTTLCCYFLLAVVHYLFMRYTMKKNGIEEGSYSIKLIIQVTIILFAVTLIFMGLYPLPKIRCGVILLIIAALIIKKKRIHEIILSIKTITNSKEG